MLDDNALEDVRTVLAAIGGFFEQVQHFLPLDDRDGVLFLVEQALQGLVVHVIRGVLETVHLNRQVVDALLVLQGLNSHLHLHGGLPGQRGELTRAVPHLSHPVASGDGGGGIDGIHHVIQRLRQGVNVLVLGNHGLAVAADTVEEAEALLDKVVAAVTRPVRAASTVDRAALERLSAGTAYKPAVMDETHALATDPLALKRGQHAVFYPDHVVFLGVGVATGLEANPPLVAIPGVGVLIRDDAKPAIDPMGRCLADVMRRVEEHDPLVALTDEDVDRLVNWDAEKYRQTLKV